MSVNLMKQSTRVSLSMQTGVRVMGRKLDMDLLVTAADIVNRMGLTEQRTVYAWVRRHDDFPAPVFERERVTLWYWPEVEAWAHKTNRTKP
jgi:predicted DNA-binding transcriptional regulator AlpA